MTMSHDEISELLGAYALDAVDPEERELVEEHLSSCARCRAEVADHREVAALLAHTGGDAPEGLWDRIAGTLEEPPPALDLPRVRSLDAAREQRARRWWAPSRVSTAIAAAAAVVIAFLGYQVQDQGQRIEELQTALRHDPLGEAYEAALDQPTSQEFTLASADGELVVRGIVTEDGEGYLRMSSLPELPVDRTYQLWGAAGPELVSLGVLGDSPTIVPFKAGRYAALAITEEAAPGVVKSTQDPVVIGELA